jgi:MYXO-CTERM domain-containing protein
VRRFDLGAALLACAVAWLGVVGPAAADVIAPNPPRDACGGKAAGDACEFDGKTGACTAQTCERTVGGVLNPSVIKEDCIVCDPSAQPKAAETPAKADPPTKSPAPTKGAAVEDAAKTSVCSVAVDPTPIASFALGVSLLVLARRRRRRD